VRGLGLVILSNAKDLGIEQELPFGRRPDPSLRYAPFRMTNSAQISPDPYEWIPASAGMTFQVLREPLLCGSPYGYASPAVGRCLTKILGTGWVKRKSAGFVGISFDAERGPV